MTDTILGDLSAGDLDMSTRVRMTGCLPFPGPTTCEARGKTIRHASHVLYTQGKVWGTVGVNLEKLHTWRFKHRSEKGKLPCLGRQPLHHYNLANFSLKYNYV